MNMFISNQFLHNIFKTITDIFFVFQVVILTDDATEVKDLAMHYVGYDIAEPR